MAQLTFEEIYWLSKYGMETSRILHADCFDIDCLYRENPKQFNQWLDITRHKLECQRHLGIQTISCQDISYPSRLKEIGDDAPPLIHLLGDVSLLSQEGAVAIIGARVADKQGLDAAYSISQMFAESGHVIVSGLALGCDTVAHEGCLSVGGKTIVVVASGLDITHPKDNIRLQERILETGGLLISEQLIGVKANPSRLIARNRLQAALSQKVVLAQCPVKSGSMHTMRFARKYQKECYAVEFPEWESISGGNRMLIEEGLAIPFENL